MHFCRPMPLPALPQSAFNCGVWCVAWDHGHSAAPQKSRVSRIDSSGHRWSGAVDVAVAAAQASHIGTVGCDTREPVRDLARWKCPCLCSSRSALRGVHPDHRSTALGASLADVADYAWRAIRNRREVGGSSDRFAASRSTLGRLRTEVQRQTATCECGLQECSERGGSSLARRRRCTFQADCQRTGGDGRLKRQTGSVRRAGLTSV